jgi:hypothetical protein
MVDQLLSPDWPFVCGKRDYIDAMQDDCKGERQ